MDENKEHLGMWDGKWDSRGDCITCLSHCIDYLNAEVSKLRIESTSLDSLIAEKMKQAEEKGKECEWCDGLEIMCADCINKDHARTDSLIERAIERCAKYVEALASDEEGIIHDPDLFEVGDKIREITPASVREHARRKE